jgi:hypothetical protein
VTRNVATKIYRNQILVIGCIIFNAQKFKVIICNAHVKVTRSTEFLVCREYSASIRFDGLLNYSVLTEYSAEYSVNNRYEITSCESAKGIPVTDVDKLKYAISQEMNKHRQVYEIFRSKCPVDCRCCQFGPKNIKSSHSLFYTTDRDAYATAVNIQTGATNQYIKSLLARCVSSSAGTRL